MQVQETNLREIQEKAGRMSDFLRMEYLESCISKLHDVEIQRFCCLELSRLYEERKMYSDAIKYIFKYRETLISQEEKNKAMNREIELLIKSGQYERADLLFRRLMEHVKEREKFELVRKIVEYYRKGVIQFERENKYSGQAKVYEKMLPYLQDPEKSYAKKRLIEVYKKLGCVRESLELEKQMERSVI